MKYSEVSNEKVASDASNDERLVGLARRAISASRLRAWSDHLQIHCHGGKIALSGDLPSFYLKQVLQTIIGNLPDVQGVDNSVEVKAVEVKSAAAKLDSPKGPSRASSNVVKESFHRRDSTANDARGE